MSEINKKPVLKNLIINLPRPKPIQNLKTIVILNNKRPTNVIKKKKKTFL
jgi:hypothetical protein